MGHGTNVHSWLLLGFLCKIFGTECPTFPLLNGDEFQKGSNMTSSQKKNTNPNNTTILGSHGSSIPFPSPSQVFKSHGTSANVEARDATARIEHKDSRPKRHNQLMTLWLYTSSLSEWYSLRFAGWCFYFRWF